VPEPSLLFVLKEIVGVGLVDHTTPLEVTIDPQSSLTVPPLFADVEVILKMGFVVKVGTTAPIKVVTLISIP
jgi:hypothetical protein